MNFKRRSIVPLIQETFRQTEFSDLTLVSSSRTFHCHKLVLGVASPYIGDLLLEFEPSDQVELVISDLSEEDIQNFLSYAYGASPSVPDNMKFLTEVSGLSEKQNDLLVKCEVDEDISTFLDENSLREEEGEYDEEESDGELQRNVNSICVVGETGRRRRKYSCPYCHQFVYQLSRHVFSTHRDHWEQFDAGRDKTKQVREREYPKKCELCPRYLSCKYHYERHIKSHQQKSVKTEMKTTEESFVCDQCGAAYSQKSSLLKHRAKHRNDYQCDVEGCAASFHDHLAFRNHMLFKHQRVIPRKRNDPKQTHINSAGKSDKNDGEIEEPEKKDLHLCSECGKGFKHPGELKKHFVIHTNEEQPEFICTTCGKKFKTKYKLAYHTKLHEPPTLPCPFCDKLFETDHKRKKHIKSIHVEDDQKLYQCNICNKGFPFFPSYESHMNSHKNIRPYSCHLCDNAYQNHFNLQQHVKKTHGVFISRSDHTSVS